MCHWAAWSFPPEVTSPAAARHAVRDELATVLVAGQEGDALVELATLVVSELVSNAVVAGCRSIDVELTVHRSHLVVAVWDDAPGRPRLTGFGPFAGHGRGLRVVDALARAWVVQDTGLGKTVRVELAVVPEAIGTLLCDPSIA